MASPWKTAGVKRRKSKNIKLSKKGNPTARPFFSRIFGMVTTLVITLGLVGIVIFLRKTLPDGSKPSFDPASLQARGEAAKPPELEFDARANLITFRPSAITARPPVLISLPSIGSTVGCTTYNIPARNVKRQGYRYTSCSTSYFTITPTPLPTTTPSSSRRPILTIGITRIPTLIIPPTLGSTVSCTTYNRPARNVKRQGYQYTDCTTSYYTITPTPTSTSSRRPILTLGPTRILSIFFPTVTPVVECSTYQVPDRRAKRWELRRDFDFHPIEFNSAIFNQVNFNPVNFNDINDGILGLDFDIQQQFHINLHPDFDFDFCNDVYVNFPVDFYNNCCFNFHLVFYNLYIDFHFHFYVKHNRYKYSTVDN
ncbi:hypothetical protein QBC35DRAFT_473047 [Podospora australis]|uniref:Uncharacterized protein n=1 Tax=Podospora australis TaxID=1536484 RepID=A0AAN7AJL1_9PEZI|nr:hypothetical protein QBC35DRAFT_473047 [Podospora australis]